MKGQKLENKEGRWEEVAKTTSVVDVWNALSKSYCTHPDAEYSIFRRLPDPAPMPKILPGYRVWIRGIPGIVREADAFEVWMWRNCPEGFDTCLNPIGDIDRIDDRDAQSIWKREEA